MNRPAVAPDPGALFASGPNFFEDLVRDHRADLLRRARALTRSREEAWDLLQDTCERTLRAPPNASSPQGLLAWMFVVMRNLALDNIRSRNRHGETTLLLPSQVAAPGSDEPLLSTRYSWEEVRQALFELSPCLRDAYELRVCTGACYAEIAQRLNVPVATVGTRLRRARLALRRSLQARREQSTEP